MQSSLLTCGNIGMSICVVYNHWAHLGACLDGNMLLFLCECAVTLPGMSHPPGNTKKASHEHDESDASL